MRFHSVPPPPLRAASGGPDSGRKGAPAGGPGAGTHVAAARQAWHGRVRGRAVSFLFPHRRCRRRASFSRPWCAGGHAIGGREAGSRGGGRRGGGGGRRVATRTAGTRPVWPRPSIRTPGRYVRVCASHWRPVVVVRVAVATAGVAVASCGGGGCGTPPVQFARVAGPQAARSCFSFTLATKLGVWPDGAARRPRRVVSSRREEPAKAGASCVWKPTDRLRRGLRLTKENSHLHTLPVRAASAINSTRKGFLRATKPPSFSGGAVLYASCAGCGARGPWSNYTQSGRSATTMVPLVAANDDNCMARQAGTRVLAWHGKR